MLGTIGNMTGHLNWTPLCFGLGWLHHFISLMEPFCGDLDAPFVIYNPTKGRFTCSGYRVPTFEKMGESLRNDKEQQETGSRVGGWCRVCWWCRFGSSQVVVMPRSSGSLRSLGVVGKDAVGARGAAVPVASCSASDLQQPRSPRPRRRRRVAATPGVADDADTEEELLYQPEEPAYVVLDVQSNEKHGHRLGCHAAPRPGRRRTGGNAIRILLLATAAAFLALAVSPGSLHGFRLDLGRSQSNPSRAASGRATFFQEFRGGLDYRGWPRDRVVAKVAADGGDASGGAGGGGREVVRRGCSGRVA
ncbi:hypothetical protein WN48_10640 [Eufriesea mexicana]|uniref:Uncharacterized protein n=1 Tax=Eufriesea mexicana TaxID=516756 RepID=A0A310S9M0_9HYME|nr:hypothetical protein WN48_10640 [Eufriesea mexicana]